MTTITFTVPDKYENKKTVVNQLINLHDGDFTCTETKEGSAYMVDFKNEEQGQEFNKKLNFLIPDIFEY